MQWINDPPCCSMKLELSDPVGGRLELTGPAAGERLVGGFVAAMGASFATGVLAFLRTPLPIPMPFKLVPLTMGLVGSSVGALGVAAATSDVSVTFERAQGVRFRWKLVPKRPRELFIPLEEIAGLEISRTAHRSSDSHGFSTETVRYQLNVVRKTGQAVPFESFSLHTQARIRQEQIEAVLRPVKARAKRKPADMPAPPPAPKKAAAPRKTAKKTVGRKATGAPRAR